MSDKHSNPVAEILTENEVSRKAFLKGGGAVVVGLTAAGSAQAINHPSSPNPAHTGAVAGPPSTANIDTWLEITPDNKVKVFAGWADLGQGTPSAALQIVAEELDLSIGQLTYAELDTNTSVSAGTFGSGSTRSALGTTGNALRPAAAAARKLLLARASAQLGVPVGQLSVKNGVVSGGGKSVTYGELYGGKLFDATIASQSPVVKPTSEFKLIGKNVPRVDIPGIVSGKAVFAHNVRIPGMLHGRIVRPRGQGGLSTGAKIVSVDASSIKNLPNVQIVRYGDFLGVVAPLEFTAIQAAAQLKVKWDDTPSLPSSGNLVKAMRDPSNWLNDAVTTNSGNVGAGLAGAATTVERSFFVPYQGHSAMGPNAAVADIKPNSGLVIGTSQAPYSTRTLVFNALRQVDPANFPAGAATNIRCRIFPGSGCYGHSEYDDVNVAAALMSYKVGKPVRVQFMRWDEQGWQQHGPAHVIDLRAGIDSAGKIVGYDATAFLHGWTQSVETSAELAGVALPTNPPTANGGAPGLGGAYNLPNRRIITKRVNGYKGFLKGTYLRAPQEPQTFFAGESLVDDLAVAAKMDPIAFRKLNIATGATGPRWSGVLDEVAKVAKWQPKVSGSNVGRGDVVKGRGVAIGGFAGTFVAVVADVNVNKKTGKIAVDHLYAVQDNGLSANPEYIRNQMIGCLVQGCSRALYEEVKFNKVRVQSLDWVSYPVLRFKDSPNVTVVNLPNPNEAPGGAGEPSTVPVPAAIGNAVFDATGVRMARFPFTPGYVKGALKAAGK
jgi:CO/xanthine dehydrogenase Mo-binding subunit